MAQTEDVGRCDKTRTRYRTETDLVLRAPHDKRSPRIRQTRLRRKACSRSATEVNEGGPVASRSPALAALSNDERRELEQRLLHRQSGKCFICDKVIDLVLHAG